MSAVSLCAERVGFSYIETPFLSELDIAICPGKVTAVVGPNGAGKTTLLNLLAGFLSPSSGRVLIGGVDLASIPRREIARRLAIIPPEVQAPFAYTARDVIEMGRYPHRDSWEPLGETDREALRRAIQRTGLEGFEEKIYNRLSSGERQRVVIARALAQAPEFLLMDEPTVHLDIHYQVEIHELVKRMASRDGVAVLMNTHDLNLAIRFCDELVIMDKGQIVSRGRPSDVVDAALLSRVYRTPLEVFPHPTTGEPAIWPARGKNEEEQNG